MVAHGNILIPFSNMQFVFLVLDFAKTLIDDNIKLLS